MKLPRITIGMKVGSFLLLPLSGVFVVLGFFAYAFHSTRDDAHIINVAGRQRGLSFELGELAACPAKTVYEERRELRRLVGEFDAALGAMRRGGVVLGASIPAASAEVIPALAEVERLWSETRPGLEGLVAAPRASPRSRKDQRLSPQTFTRLRVLSGRVVSAFEDRMARRRKHMVLVLLGGAVFLIVMGIAGILLARRFFVEPLLRLEGASRRLSAGDFSNRVEIPGQDELAQLARTFNAMAERLEEHNARQRASLLEKETLLREIHHRVKNNMQIVSSLLSMAAASSAEKSARAPLMASRDRIASMALVHEALYGTPTLATLDMSEYLGRLVGGLQTAYAPPAVRTVTECRAVLMDAKYAVHCGLLVTELLTNALKHAFPDGRGGQARVSLGEDADGVTLSVGDDGVGLPAGLDVANGSSLGLRLVRSIAAQMRASVAVERGKGGTVWRISWPRGVEAAA